MFGPTSSFAWKEQCTWASSLPHDPLSSAIAACPKLLVLVAWDIVEVQCHSNKAVHYILSALCYTNQERGSEVETPKFKSGNVHL
jgi:hypothetical protein